MRLAFHSHMLRLPRVVFERQSTSDLLSRMTNDLSATENYLVNDLVFEIISPVIELIGCCILLCLINPTLLGSCLLVGGLCFLLQSRYVEQANRIAVHLQCTRSKATEIILNILDGIYTIRVFLLQPFVLRNYNRVNRRLSVLDAVQTTMIMKQSTMGMAIESVKDFLILGLGFFFLSRGAMTIGALFASIQYAGVVFDAFRSLSEGFTRLQSSSVSAKRIFEVMNLAEDEENSPKYQHTGKGNSNSARETLLEVKTLSFSHEQRSVLSDVNLSVARGESVAIAGPSGSGKSTFLSLLLGLRDDYEGDVYLSGKELREWPRKELLKQYAYVPQTPYLFYGSIRENIALGNLEASEDEIRKAAVAASIHDEVMQFTNGYDTCVGEKGGALSGGQRQRIALARAFLKDAPILLLDEPTAHLDTRSEASIQRYLMQLQERVTVIMVAHRSLPALNSNRCLWLENGMLLEPEIPRN